VKALREILQEIVPCRPEPTQHNPNHTILDSQLWARIFALKYTKLLTENKDFMSETTTGTKKGAEAAEDPCHGSDHKPGPIAQGYTSAHA
jgi:cytochrome b